MKSHWTMRDVPTLMAAHPNPRLVAMNEIVMAVKRGETVTTSDAFWRWLRPLGDSGQ